jgi:alpha-tubulin suppressor-like RCC1 family protein
VEYFEGKRLKKVVGGDFHTIFLDTDGQLYGAGQNRYGNLGLPSEVQQYFTPTPIPDLLGIDDIFSG